MKYPYYDYAVLGGDMRQVFLVEELAHHQKKVCHYDLPALPDEAGCSDASVVHEAASLKEACLCSECIICPFPFLNPSSALLEAIHSEQTFFAGKIPDTFRKDAEEKGITVFDYLEDTSLVIQNSIATAEGAICEAIIHSPVNLNKSRCAVLGFGNCGHTLVSYLKGMFCHVTVCTDVPAESARASVIADAYITTKELSRCAGQFDFIFNTIPAPIITSNVLHNMKRTALIIDIASAPGGTDRKAAEKFRIDVVCCPGLPGKYSPSSSAKFLRRIIEAHNNVNHNPLS